MDSHGAAKFAEILDHFISGRILVLLSNFLLIATTLHVQELYLHQSVSVYYGEIKVLFKQLSEHLTLYHFRPRSYYVEAKSLVFWDTQGSNLRLKLLKIMSTNYAKVKLLHKERKYFQAPPYSFL